MELETRSQDISLTGVAQTDADRAVQEDLRARGELPVHIAAIMDGNGRWAKAHGMPRAKGHKEGVESVRDITEACAQIGVRYLTLYTFSTENWQRPRTEVSALMHLLRWTTRRERKRLLDNGVRLRAIGDLSRLPDAARKEFDEAMEATAGGDRLDLILALSYSGRWDIVQAAQRLAREVQHGRLDPDAIDEELFAGTLATHDVPDPDLLVRTGGDLRVSNYLLWQIAYTEIYLTETFWPAFRREELYQSIRDFQDRDRRFGRVEEG